MPASPSPTVTVSPDTATQDNGARVSGTADAGSRVEIRDEAGGLLGSGVTDALGRFCVTIDAPPTQGARRFVTAFDAQGKMSCQVELDVLATPRADIQSPHAPVPSFAAGSLIRTDRGKIAVEALSVGEMVLTLDNGFQPLRWIGMRKIDAATLVANPALRPIRIRAGVLGRNLPEQDLLVSPQHRVLARSRIAARLFGTSEVLVAAKQLLQLPGVDIAAEFEAVTYVQLLFDRHEIIYSNGAQTESLYTGAEALNSVDPAARTEILTIFPELRDNMDAALSARPMVSGRDGRKLTVRHVQNRCDLVS